MSHSEAFSRGFWFGSYRNLQMPGERPILGTSGVEASIGGPFERLGLSLRGEQESLSKSLPKVSTCLLGNSLGFSIGVGTTRLVASDLE